MLRPILDQVRAKVATSTSMAQVRYWANVLTTTEQNLAQRMRLAEQAEWSIEESAETWFENDDM